ncbi:MAG: serine protease [Patescibacteria group bacterium]
MELEKLTPNQAILLTLLISFVTSVATGIVTVSLIEKAPADITRVISRIIEQPIETIIQGSATEQETTVIVREGELISQAIEKALPSIVRVYRVQSNDIKQFVALGIITDTQGTVMTANALNERNRYVVVLNDTREISATVLASQNDGQGTLKMQSREDLDVATLLPASFSAFTTLVLGETVIAVGGGASLTVSAGIVAELIPETEGGPLVRAGVSGGSLVPGSPLVDIEGRVVGLIANGSDMTFAPIVQ